VAASNLKGHDDDSIGSSTDSNLEDDEQEEVEYERKPPAKKKRKTKTDKNVAAEVARDELPVLTITELVNAMRLFDRKRLTKNNKKEGQKIKNSRNKYLKF
jgi:hypothetical protein